jgi:predicted negative regulator of RcsB-dependent stress response
LAQGRKAEAAAHYQRALQIEPADEHARRALELLSATPR